MDREDIRRLLEEVKSGQVEPEEALERLRRMPFERVGGVARVDHHRALRSGAPEVVLGEFKTAEQIAVILESLAEGGAGALATRVDAEKAEAVLRRLGGARHHPAARLVVVDPARPRAGRGRGFIAVVSAGTSDAPVAEEAALTAEFLGHRVVRVADVGVAGLHRVWAASEELRGCGVAIVVAGMEGALPSVLAGLIDRPIVAVPTSVGYGVGLGGFAAMLTMLASCSPGVTVVNIDNGFGAAVAAARINRREAPDE
ncbi:MAG TPA: nickel pincer cofactor biosynthesis protein LarB [Candidatus Acidoferrum sp.]|nr:nickel pincer cofactor biosynthesis protein LarB [Candidatus Acidoferrum sp.]